MFSALRPQLKALHTSSLRPHTPVGLRPRFVFFASQVAEAAFSSFRFEVGGLTLSRIVFVVKIQRPLNAGLKLFSKRNQVPTLMDYDVTVDVSTDVC